MTTDSQETHEQSTSLALADRMRKTATIAKMGSTQKKKKRQ